MSQKVIHEQREENRHGLPGHVKLAWGATRVFGDKFAWGATRVFGDKLPVVQVTVSRKLKQSHVGQFVIHDAADIERYVLDRKNLGTMSRKTRLNLVTAIIVELAEWEAGV